MEKYSVPLESSVRITTEDALIVIDMQYDFMPGGALPVIEGDTIIAGVNSAMEQFASTGLAVILTQDWHPRGHQSFASAHPGRQPYDPFEAPGIGPVLWPDHCVPGTRGAEFHAELKSVLAQAIIRKGYRSHIDSYSGFLENDRHTETGLDGYLRNRGIKRIFVCGLALDYCVFYTAADGRDKGYEVYLLLDLTRPVASPADSVPRALHTMREKGVRFIESPNLTLI